MEELMEKISNEKISNKGKYAKIEDALAALRAGTFILIYDADGREEETDLVMAAEFVDHTAIRTMRKDGGGLIFLMIYNDIAQRLQMPFLSELYGGISDTYPIFKALIPNDIPYDTKSSFSLSINHRKTFTGVTDIDRGLTMKEFAMLAKKMDGISSKDALQLFGQNFRSPGHVPICVSSKHPLRDRFGHTELSVALCLMAGLTPVAAGSEMMGDNGKALEKKRTKAYAEEHALVFLEGKEIIEAWNSWQNKKIKEKKSA